MSGFYGADTEQLRTHAELLKNRAGTLEDLRSRLEPLVMDESIWQGPDADAFRSTWSSRVTPMFTRAHEGLTTRSTDLGREADEQDDASAAGSDGSLSDAFQDLLRGIGSGLGRAWDAITGATTIYNTLQGAFSGGKKIWDAIKQGIGKQYSAVEKGFSGLAAKLAGKLGLPTGFGPKNFFSKLDDIVADGSKLLEKAPWLSKAGRITARALPGLDIAFGAMTMVDSIKKGDTFHAVTGGMQTAGGVLLTAGTICDATGVGAVVGVPLQVAGGILVGGAALADAGKWVHDNWDGITENAGKAWDWTTDHVSDAAGAVKDTVSDTAEKVTDTVSDIGGGIKHALGF